MQNEMMRHWIILLLSVYYSELWPTNLPLRDLRSAWVHIWKMLTHVIHYRWYDLIKILCMMKWWMGHIILFIRYRNIWQKWTLAYKFLIFFLNFLEIMVQTYVMIQDTSKLVWFDWITSLYSCQISWFMV